MLENVVALFDRALQESAFELLDPDPDLSDQIALSF
jgi:hypothetical protein